jgi:hypothetical protein
MVVHSDVLAASTALAVPAPIPNAAAWAAQQWGAVDLGDRRRNARAVQIGQAIAAKPDASLPNQMATWNAVRGAYRVLNNRAVTLEALLAPHCRATLAAAAQTPVVVLAEDTTELNFTAHPTMTGLGPVGDGRGRGLLVHDTLAIVPDSRQVLGLAHLQVVLRQASTSAHDATSPEGRLWQASATAVGSPPAGVCWVHVSDRGSDDFAYLATCLDSGKHVLIRACQNRLLSWAPDAPQAQQPAARHLLDYARSLPAASGGGYAVPVRATAHQPARTAQVALAWAGVTLPPPLDSPGGLADHAPLALWLLRLWEPDAPAGVEALDWILLTSLAMMTPTDVQRAADWYYPCRWICEDFHQCLKTGLRIEHSQLDDGGDVQRLLGFCAPVAVRLLQLRQEARTAPDQPATAAVDPLMVQVLAARRHLEAQTMTLAAFWRQVAQLGGYLGRRNDGPPGWRTVWKGWRYLCDLTEGARLAQTYDTS